MNSGQNNKLKYSYITKGPILKSLITLAWPIMLSQLMQTLYNLADTLWLGRLGAEAVAAISISFPIVFMMISIAAGLTIAGTALIAQHKGRGNNLKINKIIGQLFSFIVFLSLIISFLGFIFAQRIIVLMGAETEIIGPAVSYLRTIFVGMPFMFIFFIFSSILRGIGDTKTPSILMFISVTFNIILDPFFIFGIGFFPQLNVAGAALATIISRFIVAIYALNIITKGVDGFYLKLSNMKWDIKIIKKIITIGVPSSIEQSMLAMGQILLTSLVASFGTMTLAAYGIVNRIISLPTILAFGVAAAATTMVGQNIGADKKERAEKTAQVSILIIFTGMSLLGIILFVEPEFIIRVFNDAPQVVKLGTDYLRIVALTFGFLGAMYVGNGVFKGAGKTVPPMIVSSTTLWLFRLGLAYLFITAFSMSQIALWWAVAISHLGGSIFVLSWLKISNWSTAVID
ncbi:MAG: MATE family efflux transporter [Halanaerobiales bacterium]|nr:MATE family efflux transporter [Halanaerobiales bacterium]